MATIFSDNFNRADSDSLGANWTERGADFDIDTNEVVIPNGGNTGAGYSAAYDSGSTYGSADYSVQAEVKNDSGGSYVGVCGRRVNFSTDDSDAYFATIRPSSGRVRLFRRQSGAVISIATTDAETINAATFYLVKLDMSGTTIKEFIDGGEILSVTNSDISAAGDAGLMVSGGDLTMHWDDFLSEDAGAAVGNPWYAYAQQ